MSEPEKQERTLTFWEMLGSTFAAAIGVQSSKNRTRDFTYGSPVRFTIAGVAFAISLVVGLIILANAIAS